MYNNSKEKKEEFVKATDIVIDGTRLDRIENKIDSLSEAMISLARAEERLIAIETTNNQQYERVNRLSTKIDAVEKDTATEIGRISKEVHEAKMTTNAVNKLFWAIFMAVLGAVSAVLIK